MGGRLIKEPRSGAIVQVAARGGKPLTTAFAFLGLGVRICRVNQVLAAVVAVPVTTAGATAGWGWLRQTDIGNR